MSARDASIETVGYASPDTLVPLALLRALYLPPAMLKPARPQARRTASTTSDSAQASSEAGPSSRVVFEPLRKHHPRSPSLDWIRSPAGLIVPSRPLAFTPATSYPPVRLLGAQERKRVLVTGGAGFVGSHLVDRLMLLGHDVVVLDNYVTGAKSAVAHWLGHPHFELVRHDIVDPYMVEVDQVLCAMTLHGSDGADLPSGGACESKSIPDQVRDAASRLSRHCSAIKTMKTNFVFVARKLSPAEPNSGTLNVLGLAKRTKARVLLASTSEVYGSPDEANHPQKESFWGSVNPVGPRACYDEGKRAAEALATEYHRQDGVDVRIARVFNTFGPRMSPHDGRVVSQFILQALRGEDITIYGDGSQTRSLCYVQDLIDGLILLMNADVDEQPVNLGNEGEATIAQWANMIIDTVQDVLADAMPALADRPRPALKFCPLPQDDPPRRRPDCTRARELLGWAPRFTIRDGIEETTRYLISRGVCADL